MNYQIKIYRKPQPDDPPLEEEREVIYNYDDKREALHFWMKVIVTQSPLKIKRFTVAENKKIQMIYKEEGK